MTHIDALGQVSEENRSRMKTKLMDEVKEKIQASKGRLTTHIEAFKSSVDYLFSNNFIFHHDTAVTNIAVP